MNHINDNHIKFEVSLHCGGIWPIVPRCHQRETWCNYDYHHPGVCQKAEAIVAHFPSATSFLKLTITHPAPQAVATVPA